MGLFPFLFFVIHFLVFMCMLIWSLLSFKSICYLYIYIYIYIYIYTYLTADFWKLFVGIIVRPPSYETIIVVTPLLPPPPPPPPLPHSKKKLNGYTLMISFYEVLARIVTCLPCVIWGPCFIFKIDKVLQAKTRSVNYLKKKCCSDH